MSSRSLPIFLLVGLLLGALGRVPASVAAETPPDVPPAVPGRLIVAFHTGVDAAPLVPRRDIGAMLATFGETGQPLGGAAFQLELPAGARPEATIAALQADPRVRYVEPDYVLSIDPSIEATSDPAPQAVTPNDPAWANQLELRRIEADRAWHLTNGQEGILIAVLDTGSRADHVDLAGRVEPGFNFLTGKPGADDDNGHGTFTAALAAGGGNNGVGMAGMCWHCRVLPLKILDKDGRGPSSAFAAAIRYAVDNGARIINVSAGGPGQSRTMEAAVAYAMSKNVLVVAAAGNTPDSTPNYPAAFDPVLAVAASGPDDQVTSFSTYGSFVDLAAPGVGITSAYYSNRASLARASGTSASAPIVTGAAALLLSLRPELSPEALGNLLIDTATDIGAPGRDDNFGTGRLAAYDAALAALRPGPNGTTLSVEIASGDAPGRFRVTGAGFAPNENLRVWLTTPNDRTIVARGLVADGAGNVNGTIALDGAALPGAYQARLMGDRSGRVAIASLVDPRAEARRFFQPLASVTSAPDRLYFTETQHSLAGGFRAYWEANGGVAVFGFPISEEFQELNLSDGKIYTVQYFERNRFEYHPEHKGTPYEIQLGLLGSLFTGDRLFPKAPAVESAAGLRYFPETGHTLSGEFLAYWEANGGLAMFGYPISEPFQENGRLAQYFERNRFESHPQNPLAYRVLLGRLGVDLATRNGYITSQ